MGYTSVQLDTLVGVKTHLEVIRESDFNLLEEPQRHGPSPSANLQSTSSVYNRLAVDTSANVIIWNFSRFGYHLAFLVSRWADSNISLSAMHSESWTSSTMSTITMTQTETQQSVTIFANEHALMNRVCCPASVRCVAGCIRMYVVKCVLLHMLMRNAIS
jgi:hypothetical protein